VVNGQRIVESLRERAVDIWTDPSATLLRIDPHVFNDSDDVARFFAGLDDYRRQFGAGSLQAP
jgi:hypothetical protein